MNIICPLCQSESTLFYKKNETYYKCTNCFGVFEDEKDRLNLTHEKIRYETHDNDVEDKNYQKFVSPITSSIFKDFQRESLGLDFGAGEGPIVSKVLQDNGFSVSQYDPFFHKNEELLNLKYDYIACCEVMEHFYHPEKEFELLRSMLKKGSKLYCMTEIYSDEVDFEKWYYKNDPTHVFFYSKETIKYIKNRFNFSSCEIKGRLVIFSC